MGSRQFLSVALLSLRLLAALPVLALDSTGRVVGVQDGDTLTRLTPEKRPIRVRLAEIDTPESGQPYGERAKQALSDLVFGKEIRVITPGKDQYGRDLGCVYVGSIDVNAELVKPGAAWVYRQYARDQGLYRLEADAKAAKRGLWGLPETERGPPWDWRKGACSTPAATPASPAVTAPAATSTAGFTGGGKRYCRDMTSCAEARFYLTQCGLTRLDGDHDGRPCEQLCR